MGSMLRAPRATAAAVEKAHARFATEIPNLDAMIERGFAAGNVRRVAPMAAKLLLRSVDQIRVSYAVGTPVEEIVPLVRTVGDRWAQVFDQVSKAPPEPAAARYLGPALLQTAPGHAAVVDLLAWARALGERAVVDQVAATPLVGGRSDVIVDTLLARPVDRSAVQATAIVGDLVAYWTTLTQAPAGARPAALAAYVSSWEQAWLDTGTMEPPGSEHFVGHWCFDVVPLVIALDIDDTGVRDQPVYPADLVDAARAVSASSGDDGAEGL
jgi:hypothetical protein